MGSRSLGGIMKTIPKERWLVGFLFFATFLLHFYRLSTNIPEVNVDEAGIGYSSWCLVNFGTDRYLNSWPVYIENFYFGQSAAYAYLSMIPIKVLGLNLFSVRFINAFFYTIAILPLYAIARRLSDKTTYRMLVIAAYAVSPIIIILGRIGLDCNLMLPFMIMAISQMMRALETKRDRDYILFAVFAGITLYTYSLAYIVIPFFLIILAVPLIIKKSLPIRAYVLIATILSFMALPLVLELYVTTFMENSITIGPITFVKMQAQRQQEISVCNMKGVLAVIIKWLTFDDFIFCSTKYFNYYIVSIPFIVVGIIISIKNMIKEMKSNIGPYTIIVMLTAAAMISFSLLSTVTVYRMNVLCLPTVIFIATGIHSLFERYGKQFLILVMAIYVVNFTAFINYFFVSGEYADDFSNRVTLGTESMENEIRFIESDPDLANRPVYIMAKDKNWIFTLFSIGGVNPYEIAGCDDRENVDIKYRNYEVAPQTEYDEDAVYVINNRRVDARYNKSIIEEIETRTNLKKEFIYYTVYYNK